MRYVTVKPCQDILIGRQGENKAVTVQFDVSGWSETYGNGGFALLHQRSMDAEAYPCIITADSNTVSWVITATDVYYAGSGMAQLMYIVNDVVAKSVIYTTKTMKSLDAGDEPDPAPQWTENVIKAGLDAEAYAVGTRDGEPVESDDPAYHNNAKYFAETPTDKIFWCEYGVTTASEVETALENGEFPALKFTLGISNIIVPLSYKHKSGSEAVYYFSTEWDGTFVRKSLRAYDNTWANVNGVNFVHHTSTSPSVGGRFAYGGGYGSNHDIDMIIHIDDEPTEGHDSSYIVSSGGIYNSLATKADKIPTENAISEINKKIPLYDVTDKCWLAFDKDNFIGASDGRYKSNNGYKHIFGEQQWLRVSEDAPIIVSMGSDDYSYRAYFYNDVTYESYITCEPSGGHDGSEETIYNGNYNGTSYKFVRFNINRVDQSYTQSDFEACANAFNVKGLYNYYQRKSYGDHARFTVKTDLNWYNTTSTAIDTGETANEVDIKCVIALPYSYSVNGKPTPLIMFGHGASAQITDSLWYTDSSNFANLINAFTSAGYAVFDVNNTRNASGGFPDWGSLPLMTAYIHAWEYIKQNYNVEDRLYIFSDSMGTCAALNMLKWYSSQIITAIMSAPRPICKTRYEDFTGTNKTNFEAAFGITTGAWEDRLNGFNHYENIVTINGTDYVSERFPPVKVMVGQADTGFLSEARAYYAALANSGNVVNYREVAGADHAKMSFLSDNALRAEAIAWFNRFRYQAST